MPSLPSVTALLLWAAVCRSACGNILSQSVTESVSYATGPAAARRAGALLVSASSGGGSLLAFRELIRQRAQGNQVQQCPCVKLPGADQCITYDSRWQAASVEEALLTFVDTSMDPRIYDERLGGAIGASTFACSSAECRHCAAVLAVRLRQVGLLQTAPTFGFPLPSAGQLNPALCRRLRLSRRVPHRPPPTPLPPYMVEMIARGEANKPRLALNAAPSAGLGPAIRTVLAQSHRFQGRPFFEAVVAERDRRLQTSGTSAATSATGATSAGAGVRPGGSQRPQQPSQPSQPPQATRPQNNVPRGPQPQPPLPRRQPPRPAPNQRPPQPRPRIIQQPRPVQPQPPFQVPRPLQPPPQPRGQPVFQQPPTQFVQPRPQPQVPQVQPQVQWQTQPQFPSTQFQSQPQVSPPQFQSQVQLQPGQTWQPQTPQVPQPGQWWQGGFPGQQTGFPNAPAWNQVSPGALQQIGSSVAGIVNNGINSGGQSAGGGGVGVPGWGHPAVPFPGGGGQGGGGHGGVGGGGGGFGSGEVRGTFPGFGGGGGSSGGGLGGIGGLFGRKKRAANDGILGERFVISCVERGDSETEDSDYLSLCTACWTWRQLPPDYFPRLINELVCDDEDFCLSGWGACKQRFRNVDVLRRGASGWQPTTVAIATCCDCKVKAGTEVHALVVGASRT